MYVQGNDTEATLINLTVAGCTLDERNSKGGGLNVDEGARVAVSNLTAKNNTAFFAAGYSSEAIATSSWTAPSSSVTEPPTPPAGRLHRL